MVRIDRAQLVIYIYDTHVNSGCNLASVRSLGLPMCTSVERSIKNEISGLAETCCRIVQGERNASIGILKKPQEITKGLANYV